LLNFLVIYLILWWLVFFLILPFGVERDKNVSFGNDPGAPKNSLIKKKAIISSFVTLILTSVVVVVIKNEIF
jgi:predicted secreted protein